MIKHVETPVRDDELIGFQCPVTLKNRKNIIGLLTQNYTQYFQFREIKDKNVAELAETLQKNLKDLINGKQIDVPHSVQLMARNTVFCSSLGHKCQLNSQLIEAKMPFLSDFIGGIPEGPDQLMWLYAVYVNNSLSLDWIISGDIDPSVTSAVVAECEAMLKTALAEQ